MYLFKPCRPLLYKDYMRISGNSPKRGRIWNSSPISTLALRFHRLLKQIHGSDCLATVAS